LPALGALGASVGSGRASEVALGTGVLRWLGVGSVVAHDSPRAGLVMSGLRRVLTLSWFRCWWSRDRWDGSTGAKSCAHDKALRSYPSIRMRAASPFRGERRGIVTLLEHRTAARYRIVARSLST